jgi:predicted CoA-binding protein
MAVDQVAADFAQSRRLAVVGVSKRKFGGSIYKTLKARGYQVFPVHPKMKSYDGDRCYASLTELPDGVDAAVVAVSGDNAEQVVDDARKAKITKLWFQQGANARDAALRAEAYDIRVVTGKCILMYAAPVTGIHAFHRFLVRLFGKM